MAGSQLVKDAKVVEAFAPASRTTANTLYNGAANGSGIDTRDFDEALVIVHAETYSGDASITFTCTAHTSDVGTSSTAITGAAFSAINSSNDDLVYTAGINVYKQSRYLYVKAVKTGTGAAVYGVTVVLKKGDSDPYANSASNEKVFDV